MTKAKTRRAELLHLLRRGIPYLKPYWKEYLLVIVSLIVGQGFMTLFNVSPSLLVDQGIVPQDFPRLLQILMRLGGLYVLSTLLNIAADYAIGSAESNLKRDLRIDLFTHVQYLPESYISGLEPGAITGLFARELLVVRDTLRTLIPNAFDAILQFGFAVVAFVVLDWRLAVVLLLMLPIVSIIPRRAVDKAAETDYSTKLSDAAVASRVDDNVNAHTLIRVYGLQQKSIARFAKDLGKGRKPPSNLLEAYRKGSERSFYRARMVWTLTNMQQMLLTGIVMAVGAVFAFQGTITPATFIVFVPLTAQVGDAVTKFSVFLNGLVSASTSLQRLDALIANSEKPDENAEWIAAPELRKEIAFRDVTFGYSDSKLVLNGLNLDVPIGRSVALVGRSGEGKSTLLKLLTRLYPLKGGEILLDGVPIRHIRPGDLHRQVGVVLGEDALQNATVRDNITLFDPDYTEEAIVSAAKAAGAHEFILNLPNGYDTTVGEGGKFLSRGQRKRIEFARAILQDPRVLVLDETTSALDPQSEAAMKTTIRRWAEGRTLIFVTHRLSTISDLVDHICVIDGGRVVEQGSHDDLLALSGVYYQSWRLQNGFMLSEDGLSAGVSSARLALIPLFRNVPEEGLKELAGEFTTEYFEADRVVVSQGEVARRFYIIVRGAISVTTEGYEGRPVEVSRLEDGDHFGEIALLSGSLRSATVTTTLPTTLLSLTRHVFLKFVDQYQGLRASLESDAMEREFRTVARVGRRGRRPGSFPDELDFNE